MLFAKLIPGPVWYLVPVFWALSVALWFARVAGAEPKAELLQEYSHSFKGATELGPPFELWGADAPGFVRMEADGLRMSMPAGHPGVRPPAGVTMRIVVKGDFEITTSYEVLQAPEPAEIMRKFGSGLDKQTRFTVDIVLDKPGLNAASLSRTVHGGGVKFVTWCGLQAELSNQPQIRMEYFATKARTGRLRLARRGSMLFYYASQGGGKEVALIQQYPFAADDLKEVRLVGSSGTVDSSLEVRVTDLRIRARSLVGLPASEGTTAAGQQGLLLVLASCLTITLGLGICWHLRRSRRTPRMPSILENNCDQDGASIVSFRCGECGKQLRAKSATAGKKVKCPQCGQPMLVPPE